MALMHHEDYPQLLELRDRRDGLERKYREACLDLSRGCQAANVEGMTLRELGSLLGVSKQAVSQLVGKAVAQDRLEWEEAQEARRWERRAEREHAESERGLERRSFPCPSCGRFKGRPADRCGYCGDEMGTHNGDPAELNRAYGYAA